MTEREVTKLIDKLLYKFMGNELIDNKFPELRKYLIKKFNKSKNFTTRDLMKLQEIDVYIKSNDNKYKNIGITQKVIYYFNTYIKDNINNKIIKKLFLQAGYKHNNIKSLKYIINYLENYHNEYRPFQQVLPHILFNKPLPIGIPKIITDEFIIKYFWDSKRKSLENGKMKLEYLKNYPTIMQYLKGRFPNDDFISFRHTVLRIVNKIEYLKICEHENCNNKIYDLDPRRRFCSLKCAQNSEKVNKKRQASIAPKRIEINKIISQKVQSYWDNITPNQFNKLNNRHKETLKNRSEEEKHKHGEKIVESRRKNNTMSKSKEQQQAYENLIKIFGKNNVMCEYKDKKRYPYYCDIYIKPYDLFIEINFFPAHGGCWFNSKDKNHLKELNRLRKSNKSMDKGKIKIWTESDLNKREFAKKNNLNYKVFWDIYSLWKWIGVLEYDKNYLKNKRYKDYNISKEAK